MTKIKFDFELLKRQLDKKHLLRRAINVIIAILINEAEVVLTYHFCPGITGVTHIMVFLNILVTSFVVLEFGQLVIKRIEEKNIDLETVLNLTDIDKKISVYVFPCRFNRKKVSAIIDFQKFDELPESKWVGKYKLVNTDGEDVTLDLNARTLQIKLPLKDEVACKLPEPITVDYNLYH